jgi:excinuclease ABC subunit C
MEFSNQLEDKLAFLPTRPGVYLMKDKTGNIIYVGKARNLRSRIRSYFQAPADQPIKTCVLVSKVNDFDYLVTDTEKEALILENNLIKRYKPRYNVNLKDDKQFLYLKLTVKEQFPRLIFVRRIEKDNALYFGPYASASAVRETLQIIHKLFPIRKCSQRIFKNRVRPCINYQLKRCLGPCCYEVNQAEYQQLVKRITLFLRGQGEELIAQLTGEMEEASQNLNFERAAWLRDIIQAIQTTLEKQKIVSTQNVDQDVIGYNQSELEKVIFVLFIRQGRMIGSQSFYFRKVELEDSEIVSSFISQFYAEGRFIPDEVIIPLPIESQGLMEEYLSEKKGKKVVLIFPQRGRRKELLNMAKENARLSQENRNSENNILAAVKEVFHLRKQPRIIECFDISNLFGGEAVGSQVRFEEGEPVKAKYRHYRIKSVDKIDDFGMMDEIIRRRLRRGREENDLPDLIIVDGGKGQLQVARRAIKELGIEDQIEVIGLAKGKFQDLGKGREKVFLSDRKEPLILSRSSPVLHLLQRMRDESHRFALTLHRKLRQKRQTESPLDLISGIGPVKKKNLLKYLGSLKRIQEAKVEELCQVPFITQKDASNIYNFFHRG